jgi:hypothetical protein
LGVAPQFAMSKGREFTGAVYIFFFGNWYYAKRVGLSRESGHQGATDTRVVNVLLGAVETVLVAKW